MYRSWSLRTGLTCPHFDAEKSWRKGVSSKHPSVINLTKFGLDRVSGCRNRLNASYECPRMHVHVHKSSTQLDRFISKVQVVKIDADCRLSCCFSTDFRTTDCLQSLDLHLLETVAHII
jgi:hypothetical protein